MLPHWRISLLINHTKKSCFLFSRFTLAYRISTVIEQWNFNLGIQGSDVVRFTTKLLWLPSPWWINIHLQLSQHGRTLLSEISPGLELMTKGLDSKCYNHSATIAPYWMIYFIYIYLHQRFLTIENLQRHSIQYTKSTVKPQFNRLIGERAVC